MQDYHITRLGHLGDGIAEGPLFAPLTLPGEVVTARRDGDQLCDVKIVEPSEHRVSPPCRHFKSCGGCQLQQASDAFLADWKVEVVKTALAAQGIEADFAAITVSPPCSRRRATFAARRTKKGAMAGFHAKGSDMIVEIPDCKLLHPDLLAARPVAEALAITGSSRKNGLDVAVSLSDNGLDVVVRGGKPLDGPLRMALAQLTEAHNLARLTWEDEVIATRLPPEQDFDGVTVVPPPGAFLQATKDGENALRHEVLRITQGAKRIVDLFAGCGTFALPLAKQAEVHAVEGDTEMTKALDAGWRHAQGHGLKAVTHEARDLFRRPLMPDELASYNAVVIDPPRAGAEAQIYELAQSDISVIAHVSCNPGSFARDARHLLDAGFTMGPIKVVDQFRWSSHVELVAGFVRP
jgi:23S rRNA (uracil1939-C5)-methyltransferase